MLPRLSNLLHALSLMFAGALTFTSAPASAALRIACKAMAHSRSCRVARIGRRARYLRTPGIEAS